MKKTAITVLLIFLFFGSEMYARNPVLFVHGFTGNADSFGAIAYSLIKQRSWQYGGELTYNRNTGQVEIANAAGFQFSEPRAGDFYLMDFSDYADDSPSQNLTLDLQAQELKRIVQKILELTGKPQIILVGHSMGALAVRAYLQWSQPTNVEQAIFVAGPHAGSETALLANDPDWQLLAMLLAKKIDPNSAAVKLLKPGSAELRKLNDFFLYPFPKNTRLACMIVEGGDTRVLPPKGDQENDGLVSVASQDLTQISGAVQATPQEIYRFVFNIKSDATANQLAHFEVLKNPQAINTLVQIIEDTFPRAQLDDYYMVGGGGYVIRLDHAPFRATVEAMVWQNNKRLYDLYQPVEISNDAGQRVFMGTTPVDTANFSVQFRLAEWISNCVRVQTQKDYFPVLKLGPLSSYGTSRWINIVITKAKPLGQVTLRLAFSSGKTTETTSAYKTDAQGSWNTLLNIDPGETALVGQAFVDGYSSNQAWVNLTGARKIFSLQENPFAQDFFVTGMKLDRLPADNRFAFLGLDQTATFEFHSKVVFFRSLLQTNANLAISVMPLTGREYQLPSLTAGPATQTLQIRESSGIYRITIRATGTASPLWTITDLWTASDDRPPLLLAGFSKDPIPKGEKSGGGWWRVWIFLQQPEDIVPVQLEGLEFAFRDQNGALFLTQTVPVADIIRDQWFIRGLFSFSFPPFSFCRNAQLKPDNTLWLPGPGGICQELVYTLTASPIEPRFVQLRFFVKDFFDNRQTITYNAVMLPQ